MPYKPKRPCACPGCGRLAVVKLIRMNDPYSTLKSGDVGTVDSVDEDKGSTLWVVYGEDSCEIIEKN